MNNDTLSNKEKTKSYVGWIAKCAAFVVFDVLACYFSYFLALVIRFYANGGFLPDGNIYLETFHKIAPYVAAATILIFALFGLYSRRWKYAGFYDLVRIIMAHATIFVLLFVLTYLFFERMPLTFYFLGTAMLFCFTCLSRFAIPMADYLIRKYRSYKNSTANVMIVGIGNTANYARRLLENREENSAIVKCFFALDPSAPTTPINGIPVLKDQKNLGKDLKKHKIDRVCFADPSASAENVRKIKEVCTKAGVEVRDYSDALVFDPYSLSFGKLMKHIAGSVKVRNGNEIKDFRSGEEAVRSFSSSDRIEAISAADGAVVVDISSKKIEKNDINEEWVKKTESETGENVSFF